MLSHQKKIGSALMEKGESRMDEKEDILQAMGIFIRAKMNELGNAKRFEEAQELQELYLKLNKYFDNGLMWREK